MKKSPQIFSKLLRLSTIVLYLMQQSASFPNSAQAAEAITPAETSAPELKLKDSDMFDEVSADVSSRFADNADDENPLSPASKDVPAGIFSDPIVIKTKLPANAVVMQSNPNFYYAERTQGGSVPKVYDIYSKSGLKLFTVDKETASIRGNYGYAVGVPDVSPDGKYLILGKFQQSTFTGHVQRTITVQIYNMLTRQLEAPVITVLETDNREIGSTEFPTEIRFVAEKTHLIKVANATLGSVSYYDAATHKPALPPNAVAMASNSNFYYAERTQPGSTPKVYDIFSMDGVKLFTIAKETAPHRGNFSKTFSAPDVSRDGKHLVIGKFHQSTYTGHVLQSMMVHIYSMSTQQPVSPTIALLSTDNQPISDTELLTEVRFVPGNSVLISVTNRNFGQLDYYSVITHKRALPPNAVAAKSNSNFYYSERTQPGSVPKVYDIFSKDGTFLFSIPKETAQIQGNYSYAVGVPDISPDGKYLVISNFQNSRYSGHVIQTLSVKVYNMQTKQLEPPSIKLLEKDNTPITPQEFPGAIEFIPGNGNIIRISRGRGIYEYYDLKTRTQVPSPSSPLYTTQAAATLKK